ncbi:hypothetical protein [Flavobacterium sp. 245]|uniref:hypothetical protein n=1 Tax=Flavobacterium sp. 245 TaxID=2512115 RepID=UPI00105CF22D|nr:hypothetical protein [Flavobacterium sp. 245]TDO95610.1 hypothetical protein EV145_11325 [Flavobacterium sp. 245]
MKRTILIVLLLLMISCDKKQEGEKVALKNKTVVFFDPLSLGASGVDANLKITAYFSECGEWGGHHEDLKIFSKEGNYKDQFLNYRKTNIDCDNRDSKGRNIETVVVQKTIKLTEPNKKSLIAYMKRMIESKVQERFPGHAGDQFSILNADSTFVIEVYDKDSNNVRSYNQLLTELRLHKK